MDRELQSDSGALLLAEQCGRLTEFFSPKVIGEVNDQYVKVAKIKGEEVPWHRHEHEDELFYVVKGALLMECEGRTAFMLKEGEFFVVRKQTNHRVSSSDECWIMLVESKSTQHTGDVIAPITKSIADQLR